MRCLVAKDRSTSNQLTADQQQELDALSAMTDDQIDTIDIPEVIDWRNAKRGLFYRPIKQQITINRALREYVAQQQQKVNP